MKRFYCTICQRVKRVRKYPISVSNKLAEDVMARVGRCDKHESYARAHDVEPVELNMLRRKVAK